MASRKPQSGSETELDPEAGGLGTSLAVQCLQLTVLEGDDEGEEFVTRTPSSAVGSHESNDWVLNDPRVSRFHLDIAIDEGGAKVIDRGSRNGTWLDGVRIESAFLRDGSVIRIGRTHLRCDFTQRTVTQRLFPSPSFGSLVGISAPMRASFALMDQAARSHGTVLLTGETGTGKEEAARSIHLHSERRDGPFVVVDCGAITRLESQLFGHVRGAFTGAIADHMGAFEQAHEGTLFLDEIGELPIDLQPKLLRVLAERTVLPVGAQKRREIDVRVVAATHRDLPIEINAGRFRPDLYYRLAVLPIRIPALRERPEDIPLLVQHLSAGLSSDDEARRELLEAGFISMLKHGAWPGNVRQLRNHLERALLLGAAAAQPGTATPSLTVDMELPWAEARTLALREFERRYLTELMERSNDKPSVAMRHAKLNRAYLYELLVRHGMR